MNAAESAAHASRRFGLGPAPGERERIGGDARGWLLAQIVPEPPLPVPLRTLPPVGEAMKLLPRFVRRVRGAAKDSDPGVEALYRDVMQQHLLAELGGRVEAAVSAAAPLQERLAHFWANHFAVSGLKPAAMPLIGAYEREAIRPHLFGRFETMLIAAARHPAMLTYLDNAQSVGPNSRVGKRREAGLNENLAREILELHTLGVDGGYTQADVTGFARVLTGWSVDYRMLKPGEGGYRFFAERHEPGAQTVLGRRYAEDGEAQGLAVLRDLAAHPATARFIATKLARHFVADDPPPAAVDALARAYRDSDGDLAVVCRALIARPETWDRPGAKFRSPDDWLIAALRLLRLPGAPAVEPRGVFAALNMLGQRPFSPPSPAGWPDRAADWLTADALWKRLEVAQRLAEKAGVTQPVRLADATYGEALSAKTREVVAGAAGGVQGLALLLASPEFNRR